MEIKDRIRLIMERENMIAGTFADSIGVQQSTLSHVINGRNRPSLDVVMKVHQRYNYINLEWLLYGTGEMMAEHTFATTHSPYSDLFHQKPGKTDVEPDHSKNRKEAPIEPPVVEIKPSVIQEIKYIERPPRKITEIRIFFDDNTYEIFKGEK
jgi:transcriptional regulator with XRE-family HTH domain